MIELLERRRPHGMPDALLRTPPPVPVWHVRGSWDVHEQEHTLGVAENAAGALELHAELKAAGAQAWVVCGPLEDSVTQELR